MATNGDTTDHHHHAVIGNAKNFWLYDSRTGFDLTHPPTPDSPPVNPRLMLQTSTTPIAVDPAKTALLVIDMQNFFLSPARGRTKGPGHKAVEQLVQYAVPAARKAGVRVVWVNWGLSQEDIDEMPPAFLKGFGFDGSKGGKRVGINRIGEITSQDNSHSGMGSWMGEVMDPDDESGGKIDAGKFLMRDQWNTALYPPLDRMYEEGKRLDVRPDVWIHKNRMSGIWSPHTPLAEFLEREGIKTLLFTGVNTDQCVGGTYQDSFSKGCVSGPSVGDVKNASKG